MRGPHCTRLLCLLTCPPPRPRSHPRLHHAHALAMPVRALPGSACPCALTAPIAQPSMVCILFFFFLGGMKADSPPSSCVVLHVVALPTAASPRLVAVSIAPSHYRAAVTSTSSPSHAHPPCLAVLPPLSPPRPHPPKHAPPAPVWTWR